MTFLTERKDIEAWLVKMNIEDYFIHPDGVVDVNESVDIARENLTHIPVQFGVVDGYFDAGNNQLTSLVGCPRSVKIFFTCENNQLTSLEGCPSIIVANHGGAVYYLVGNPWKSHALCLLLVEGLTTVDGLPVDVEKIIDRHMKSKDVFACQQEFIEAGFDDFAQL